MKQPRNSAISVSENKIVNNTCHNVENAGTKNTDAIIPPVKIEYEIKAIVFFII